MTIQIFKGVQNQELVLKADYDKKSDDYDKLAAECAAQNKRMQALNGILNNADNSYCMCGDSIESHATGGCGSPTGMLDYLYGAWLESEIETPARDAALADIKAQVLDELVIYATAPAGYHSENISVADVREFAANIRAGVKP